MQYKEEKEEFSRGSFPREDPNERELCEERKIQIQAIYDILSKSESLSDSGDLEKLCELIHSDNPEIIDTLSEYCFIPPLVHHLSSTLDLGIVEACLECICPYLILFDNINTEDSFPIFLSMLEEFSNEEMMNLSIVAYLITAVTVSLRKNNSSHLSGSFFQKLIELLTVNDSMILIAIVNFVEQFVSITDTLAENTSQAILVFVVLTNINPITQVKCAKIIGMLVKRKFISLNIDEYRDLFFRYLTIKSPELLTHLFSVISFLDEKQLSIVDDQVFVDAVNEIISFNTKSNEHEEIVQLFDKMKVSVFSSLFRLSQIYPLILKNRFLGEFDCLIPVTLETCLNAPTKVKTQAGLLLGCLIKQFPGIFMKNVINGESSLIDAITGILHIEDDSTYFLIAGLKTIASESSEAFSKMKEVGIIDSIEELIESSDNSIEEIASDFLSFAQEQISND